MSEPISPLGRVTTLSSLVPPPHTRGFTVADLGEIIEKVSVAVAKNPPTVEFYKKPGGGYIGMLGGSMMGSIHLTDEQFEAYKARAQQNG